MDQGGPWGGEEVRRDVWEAKWTVHEADKLGEWEGDIQKEALGLAWLQGGWSTTDSGLC